MPRRFTERNESLSFCIRFPACNGEDNTYTVIDMKCNLLVALGILASAALVQCAYDGPPPTGSIRVSDPKALAYMNEGMARETRGDAKGAIKQYERLIDYNPIDENAPEAYFRMGKLYEQCGEYTDAFDAYKKIVEKYHGSHLYEKALNRQLALAHSAINGQIKNKVLWLWNVNMDSAAVIKWLQFIRDAAPYNEMAATTTWMLGKYLIGLNRPDEAREAYQKLVEDYPSSKYAPEAQLMVARLWAESVTKGSKNQVNLANAQEAYEEFLLRFPNHPEAKQAKLGVGGMKKAIVQQQLEVGEFYYFRARDIKPAVFCFEDVARQKDVNPEAAAKAQNYLNRIRKGGGSETSAR